MDPKNVKKTYTLNGLRVNWQSGLCVHSGHCAKNLPGVFRPRQSPWIDLGGGTAEDIIRVVKGCPSGALSLGPSPDNGEKEGNS